MTKTAGRETAEQIKRRGKELGFDLVGITAAEPLERESLRLQEWLDLGFHASMGWMARTVDKRGDPRKILEGARSVIVAGLNYYAPVAHRDDLETGKISRYAWGEDYHKIVLEKLEAYSVWLSETYPGSSALAYADTGPLMEKALAAKAGIGWLGKHTNIISPEYGSWLFLGEIVTTLDVPPDEPATDHCGSCSLCIEACPTNAIVEPYVLDAGKCISYLTIEHRGEIPERAPRNFDGWIFGCDICQDVCPWNQKFGRPTTDRRFFPKEGQEAPSLREWARMTADEFPGRFAGSPIKRARWEGLMRNIRIVLEGNGRTASAP